MSSHQQDPFYRASESHVIIDVDKKVPIYTENKISNNDSTITMADIKKLQDIEEKYENAKFIRYFPS